MPVDYNYRYNSHSPANVHTTLNISFKESCFGAVKDASYESSVSCIYCDGKGKNHKEICEYCSGKGFLIKTQTAKVHVSSGMGSGSVIRICGKGNLMTPHASDRGDLFVHIQVEPDTDLSVNGKNLITEAEISPETAENGGEITIKYFEKSISLTVPPQTKNGAYLKLAGLGIPYPDPSGVKNDPRGFYSVIEDRRGDLYVHINISGQHKDAPVDIQEEIPVVTLSLEEACLGTKKTVHLDLYDICPECSGKSLTSGENCPKCGGTGRCLRGTAIDIQIPAGIDDGHTLMIRDKGHLLSDLKTRDALRINIHVEKDEELERDGIDIRSEITVPPETAEKGGVVTIRCIDSITDLKIPSGSKDGAVFRLGGKGVYNLARTQRGDHYVTIHIDGQNHAEAAAENRSADNHNSLTLSFAESCLGCQKNITYEVYDLCPKCRGKKTFLFGQCKKCSGEGRIPVKKTINYRIPPLYKDGETMCLHGIGDVRTDGSGTRDNLDIVIHVDAHPLFRRDGNDILSDISIPQDIAEHGGDIDIECIDGTVRYHIPPDTKEGTVLRLQGKGAIFLRPKQADILEIFDAFFYNRGPSPDRFERADHCVRIHIEKKPG